MKRKLDPGSRLAQLVQERESLKLEAKDAARASREEIDRLTDSINALAEEIASGQGGLFEEGETA